MDNGIHLFLPNSLPMSGSAGTVTVVLSEGQELRLILDGCTVKEVADGSPFKDKLLIGDLIRGVNGEPVTSENIMESLAKEGEVNVDYTRYPVVYAAQETAKITGPTRSADGIPPEREKNVQRKEGFTYHFIEVVYKKGLKFGLGIKHFQNKVIVSKIDDGSLSALHLKVMDHIIDINGTPVSDKDVCRDLLIKGLQKSRRVDMIVERPENDNARESMNQALHASQMQPPSVAMGTDIREIVAKQQERMKQNKEKKGGILRQNNVAKGRVQVENKQREVLIANDNEGKELKRVGQ